MSVLPSLWCFKHFQSDGETSHAQLQLDGLSKHPDLCGPGFAVTVA